jgi:hypothetical protein
MRVQIIRIPGDSQAPSIIDALCSVDIAGMQRGEEFLNSEGFDKKIYDVSMQHQTLPEIGSILEIADASIGEVFRGRLTAIAISVSRMEAGPVETSARLTIERPIIE